MVALSKSTPPHTLAREAKYRLQQAAIVLFWFLGEVFTVCVFFAVAMWDTAYKGKSAEEQLKDA